MPNAHVATEPVGGLLALPEQAGIPLRVLADIGPFWAAVITGTLGFRDQPRHRGDFALL